MWLSNIREIYSFDEDFKAIEGVIRLPRVPSRP